MSDLTLEQKLEALAKQGFGLVVRQAERFVIEKTHLDGTLKFVDTTLEGVIAQVEEKLEKFPGRFGHSISRSDGTHEGADLLRAQAGAEVKTITPAGAGADVAGASEPEPEAPNEPEVPEGAVES